MCHSQMQRHSIMVLRQRSVKVNTRSSQGQTMDAVTEKCKQKAKAVENCQTSNYLLYLFSMHFIICEKMAIRK